MGVAEQSQGRATQGRHSLRADHVMVHGRQATQSKHPNQASKDICSNRVGSITYMFGFHRRKGGGGWTHLDHLSTCDSLLKQGKLYVSKMSCEGMNHWYFRIMWNGRDGGHTKEPAPPPCKGRSSSKRREVALVVDRAGAQTWRVSVSPKDGWRM